VNENPDEHKIGKAVATRVKPSPQEAQTKMIQIDFKGDRLTENEKQEEIEGEIASSENGEVSSMVVSKIEESSKYRLSFKVKINNPNLPVELVAKLKHKDDILTENWTYTLE
jgi:glucan biosynthesis protein